MKSVGKLIYSPRSHLGSSSKWAAVFCDDEIGKYYRHLFIKQYPYLNGFNRGNKLNRPVWGSHISFVRNSDQLPNPKLWELNNNKLIEFNYEPEVQDNGTYFWLRVSCPSLSDLREKLGLSRKPKLDFHLTIGVLNTSS
jgi:hypothetical protein